MPLDVSTRIGPYEIVALIGTGGMGEVYRARHALLRRPTAVKLLPAEKAGDGALARFEREVQLTASLVHPNTVTIFDYGHTPDGVFYYAEDYHQAYLHKNPRGYCNHGFCQVAYG